MKVLRKDLPDHAVRNGMQSPFALAPAALADAVLGRRDEFRAQEPESIDLDK